MARKRKRRRIKKGRVFVATFITVFVIGLIFFYFSIRFESKNKIEINVGEKFKYKMKAKFLSKDISSELKQSGKVNSNEIGDYKVTYSYSIILGLSKRKTVLVSVVDKEKPTIELNGGDKLELFLNNDFEDPGYKVTDNYDKEVKVTVKGDIDTKKAGTYYLTYVATDSSGNKEEIVRKVIVSEKSPTDVSISEFDIHDYFDSSVILGETEDYGSDYIEKIAFVGDSVPWQFGLQHQWNSNNVYAAACTGPSNIYSQKAYWKNVLTTKTIPDLIKENKPEYILVSIGFCEIVSSGNVDLFISNYGKFIDDIKKNSPNTKIILNSMYPVISETLRGNEVPTNKQTNEYNYYIASIAKKYKLKYLDSASVLKNSQGLAEPSLTGDDGYHPNISGMKKVIQYVRTHGYK